MAARESEQQKLARRLVKGLKAKRREPVRESEDLWLVKSAGKTVACVIARSKFVRIDLKEPLPKKAWPKGISLAGESKSWPGGGAVFAEDAEEAARKLLEAAIAQATTRQDS